MGLEMETKNRDVPTKKIKAKLLGGDTLDYFSYAEKQAERYRVNESYNSAISAQTSINRLKKFVRDQPLFMDDITPRFLNEFEEFLRVQMNLKPHSVHTTLKFIRTNFNRAIQEDLVSQELNPFIRYKLKAPKSERSYLTEEQLARLEELDLATGSRLEWVRDAFVFACWGGGIRVSDLLMLRNQNWQDPHLKFISRKTKKSQAIKLPTRAREILEKYADSEGGDNGFIFPFMRKHEELDDPERIYSKLNSKSGKINVLLKTLGEQAEIPHKLTFHLSRHTWATRALRKGMRMEYVSKNMGHADLRTTQIYAKIIQEEADNAMDVFD